MPTGLSEEDIEKRLKPLKSEIISLRFDLEELKIKVNKISRGYEHIE
tara:strand:- start:1550 stop:1690 length:141 start_codon:yes stop_codon:yes gene_type:complete